MHNNPPNKTLPRLQEYLETLGVLDGTPEEIAAAKVEFRRLYKRLHKKQKRNQERKIEVWVTETEWGAIEQAATTHQLSMVAMLKKSALAYLAQRYIVPRRQEVGELELLLSRIYDGLQNIDGNDRIRLMDMQRGITDIEARVSSMLRSPRLLDEVVREVAVDEEVRQHLLSILTNPPAAT
jgi:hypothetical protein